MQPHTAAQPEAVFHQAAAQPQTQYPASMQPQAQQRAQQAPAQQQAAGQGRQAAAGAQAAPGPAGVADPDVWPDLCERFCLQFLVLAEKMRPAMDLLERQEEDPDRLEALYEIDHGVTRMRRAARDLRVLAGRDGEEASGADTSLLDVIRMAESSIEQYRHVTILRVVELAVPAYAAEDLASLVAALLDNATRYSPSRVTVSAHLLDNGAVMLRIEDAGIGMSATQLDGLNTALAGPVPPMTDETSRQTGFPVVHRLARRHGIGVRLAGRTGGTVAMVTVPPALLCEIPPDEPHTVGAGEMPSGMAHLAMARRVERPSGGPAERSEGRPARPAAGGDPDLGGLPRRERASLRPVAAPAPDAPSDTDTDTGTGAGTDTGADAGSGGGSSFAADLDAFTAGARLADPAPEADPAPGAEAASHDPEEGRQ
ncbi:sensor histidine kinase [Actinomadura violacea]|uniref:histidine kinase n=1 Tax=Actinomadura violacea TaxID=2819934 RepID=A0ABS3RMB3_9ACTN|nr:ATP-binding protein [Actinomadura violacea]MBO2457889.1 HAMP domain-containing histidine kinase [Actinomadura violacea]